MRTATIVVFLTFSACLSSAAAVLQKTAWETVQAFRASHPTPKAPAREAK